VLIVVCRMMQKLGRKLSLEEWAVRAEVVCFLFLSSILNMFY